jgi:hypothetical protein
MTMTTYVHHRITCGPRQWQAVATQLAQGAGSLTDAGGALYGLWRSQIGRPRDEVTAITSWQGPVEAADAEARLRSLGADFEAVSSLAMVPTLRPSEATPPTRQGNYAFRWFVTPEKHWDEFLDLCAGAWPGFEAAYDSQVIGLWRCNGGQVGGDSAFPIPAAGPSDVVSLLLTRRPDLAMWERSKLPQGASEKAVRDALSRRYDLCDWTAVYTTTLLTAADRADMARWT